MSARAFIAFLRCEAKQAEDRARALRNLAANIDSQASFEEVNRKGRRKRDPSRTKRQHTAYTLFVQENFEAIKKNNPDMPPKDIISMVAQQWSEVSGEERELWKQRAMAGTQDVSENLVHELGEDFYHGDDDDEDENKKKRAVGHNKREKETVQV